jgi:hypothetical protein
MAGGRGGASAGQRATAIELLARAAPISRSALESGGAKNYNYRDKRKKKRKK